MIPDKIPFGRWAATRAGRLGENAAVALGYLLCMWILIAIPPNLFLMVTRTAGANVDGALVLTPMGRWLIYLIFGATFLWSFAMGGFARALLRPRYIDWPWLALFGLGLLAGLTMMFENVRAVASQLHTGPHDDNASVAAFLAFWLLMVGYAAKAVWDEARDRIAAYIETRIEKDRNAYLVQPDGAAFCKPGRVRQPGTGFRRRRQ